MRLKPIGLEDDIEIPDDLADARVSNFIIESNEWDIPKLEELLPLCKDNEIRAIPILQVENGTNTLLWENSSTGNFSVSSTFLTLVGTEENVDLS